MTPSEAEQSLVADQEAHLRLVAALDDDETRRTVAAAMLTRAKSLPPLFPPAQPGLEPASGGSPAKQ